MGTLKNYFRGIAWLAHGVDMIARMISSDPREWWTSPLSPIGTPQWGAIIGSSIPNYD